MKNLLDNDLEARQNELDEQITRSRKEIRTDRMDMSFGEIMNMYENNEIVISPEFQRAFRWDNERQTKFIESIMLGIPIPPIFVAETSNNVWELVDGLQRLSTVLSFFGILKDEEKNNLVLSEGSILSKLAEFNLYTIPLKYKLLIKRAVCRVEVIRFDSEFDMRYELFNRLNTGGVALSEQEIRNCIFRGYSNRFNAFINDLGNDKKFQQIVYIRDEEKETMYCQELVLRYFTLKNVGANFKSLQDHMSSYMLELSKHPEKFNFEEERDLFFRVVNLINKINENIFKLGRINFSTSMYDAIMVNFALQIDYFESLSSEEILAKINKLTDDETFRQNTGASSSSKSRIRAKIKIASTIFTPEG